MTTEQIVELVVAILPSVIAVFSTLGMILNVIKKFADLKKQVADMKCIDDLKVQMSKILDENYSLKKTLNETMTKIDHIERS